MESKIQLRKERARRASALRSLDSAMRDAYRLVNKALAGESVSMRDNWNEMSDYSWRRARSLLIAIGILDSRNHLLMDAREADETLNNEFAKQSDLIWAGRTPTYLSYRSYGKRGRVKR